jgi:hypothetical protein
VYGFGERKTPKPFITACDQFIYIENLTYTYTDNAASPAGTVLKLAPRTSAAQPPEAVRCGGDCIG